jgi:hypothetical protein
VAIVVNQAIDEAALLWIEAALDVFYCVIDHLIGHVELSILGGAQEHQMPAGDGEIGIGRRE